MIYEATKRNRGTLTAYCQVKEDIMKRLILCKSNYMKSQKTYDLSMETIKRSVVVASLRRERKA